MNTANPLEYLTLLYTVGTFDFSNYAPGSNQANTGSSASTTTFDKVRINLASLSITTDDTTFTRTYYYGENTNCTGSACRAVQPYTTARSCSLRTPGWANADLRGTPFSIDALQAFPIGGDSPYGSCAVQPGVGQVLQCSGGGTCGWVGPTNATLRLVWA